MQSARTLSFMMLFFFVALLSGGTAFVTAARHSGAAKRAHDGQNGDFVAADVEISDNKCDASSLSGLLQGNLQAAIPFCAQLGAKIVTVTVTSTSTRTRIRTKYTTTTVAGGMGNGKVKARAAEVTPAPKVLVGRDGAVEALIHQLEECPQSAVAVACTGGDNQRVLTTTTTEVEKVTVTSTKKATVTETEPASAFRIYSELILDKRKRSTDEMPSKWYWEQDPDLPYMVRLTTNNNMASVFNLDYSTPGYLGSLTLFSTSNEQGWMAIPVYAINDGFPEAKLFFSPLEAVIVDGWPTVRWKVNYMAQTIIVVDPLDFYLCYCLGLNEEYWLNYNYVPVLDGCVRADLKTQAI